MSKNKRLQKNRQPKNRQPRFSVVQIIILAVIGLVTLITVSLVLIYSIFTPERQITSKIETLAASYYEDIIYANMQTSDKFSGDPASALERYRESGLTPVSLQQLIILNKLTATDTADLLLKYCDEESTTVRFFPEPPYTKTAYRIEIYPSCNF